MNHTKNELISLLRVFLLLHIPHQLFNRIGGSKFWRLYLPYAVGAIVTAAWFWHGNRKIEE